MSILGWLTGRFSIRGRGLLLIQRGMARANKSNQIGAISAYTTAIDMSAIPADVRATALYNRALIHFASGEDSKGIEDLNQVLTMDVTHSNVKTMARQALARMKARSEKRAV